MRVLVVEDNSGLRLALQHGLAHEGLDVVSVSDAEAAYDCIGDVRPEVTLLDWRLPGGDAGPAACRRLRELHPEGEVVMFTGLDDPRDQRAAFQAGAAAFLHKGVALEHVVSVLHSAVGASADAPSLDRP